MRHRHIVVEGPVGCGKTSLANRLAQKLNASSCWDPKANPFLPLFYRDMRRYARCPRTLLPVQRVG